jgi:iron complex outermembrane receptor protein
VRAAWTASKTETPLEDVPAAIVVVPREVLSQQNAQTMNEAVRNASGVTPVMGGSYGFADRYLMRGLSQRFLRDGLPDGPSFNGYLRSMTDVERIEVLKGPGSALYGRTEPGGVINIVTQRPLFASAGLAEVGAGSFGTSKLLFSGGGPLSSTLGTRIDASYQHSDGYRRLGRTLREVMPSLEIRLAEEHALILDYDFRDIEIVPDNYGIPYAPIDPLAPAQNRRPLTVDPSERYYSPFDETSQRLHRVTLRHEWLPSDSIEVRTAIAFDKRRLNLVRNASGNVTGTDGLLSLTGRNARDQEDLTTFLVLQNEIVLHGATGPLAHTVLVGVEAEQSRIHSRRDDIALPDIDDLLAPVVPEAAFGNDDRSPNFDRRVRSDSVGAYAQDQVALGSVVKLRAGGRFDRVMFSDAGLSHYPTNAAPLVDRRITSAKGLVTGQLGAVLQPLSAVSLYSGISNGKFMNIQTESPSLSVDPESSFQVEAGVKTALFDDRLHANVAGFWTTRANFYITPYGGGDPLPVGKQATTGIEIDAVLVALQGLTVTANYAVYRARISADQQQALGMTNVNIKGKKPQGVPNQAGNLWAAYEIEQGLLHGLGVGAGLRYQGESFADALNLNRVPPYLVLDGGLFYRQPRFEAQLNVRNLTGTKYFSYATFSGAAPGEPLAAQATLRYKY